MLPALRNEALPERPPGRWRKSKPARRRILAEPIERAIGCGKGPPGARLFLQKRVPAANPGWSGGPGNEGGAKASSVLVLS
jgi:hypothetical protein